MKRYLLVFVLLVCLQVTAQFTPGNIVVVRVGDGTPITPGTAAPISLLEYTIGGVLISTTDITNAFSGNFTQSSSATSEGMLSLSSDGRFLSLPGYSAPIGTSGISTGNHDGIIARTDYNNVTSEGARILRTTGNAYVGTNLRSVTTSDGSGYWASGNSGGVTGGVRFLSSATTSSGTQLNNTTLNTRGIRIFNQQLYISSASGAIRIATVGAGLPVTTGQSINNLPVNIPTTTHDPYEFVLLDADPTVPGPDLLYISCLNTATVTGGVYKYSYDGSAWTDRGSLTGNVFGIAARFNCSMGVELFITRAINGTSKPIELYSFTDNSTYNTNISNNGSTLISVGNLLASAGNNNSFGGVAFTPTNGGFYSAAQTIGAGNYNVLHVFSGGSLTLTGNVIVYDKVIVESEGILNMESYTISSPSGIGSSFEVKSGGTIRIGSPDGITASAALGNVQTCFRKYDAGANYEYYGTATQVTGDGLPANLTGTLKINNSAGLPTTGVTLSQSTTVAGTLDLTLGKLTTSAGQLVTINNGATIINAGANSFINGPAKKVGDDASFTFPVGKGSIYASIGIAGGTGANAADEFTAEYVRGNPQSSTGACPTYCQSGMDHVSYVEYWTLERNVGSASKNVTLDVHATSFCAEIANTYVSQWDPSAPNKWSREPSTSILTGTIGILELGTITTVSPINSFAINRYFTLGTDRPFLNNPLPVTLVDFKVKKYSEHAAIAEWELSDYCFTATKFELQRSTDKESFSAIAVLPGKENSKLYFFNDTRLAKGANWYRLKITEVDGKITYSKVVAIINDTKGLLITSVYPNPVNNTATITLSAARSGSADILLYDISGTVVYRRRSALAEGTNNLPVELGKLSAGVYHLAVQTADSKAVYRLVKQ